MISGEEEEGRRASLAGLRGLVLLTRALSTSLLPVVTFHLCTSCSVIIFTSFPVTGICSASVGTGESGCVFLQNITGL